MSLLDTRLCDLKVSIKGSFLEPLIARIDSELARKGITLKPHYWISDEWFTPDGVTGIAIPFYLLRDDLMELEREQVGYVEGESKVDALKILRHEVGHVIDNAYNLRKDIRRRELFGKSSTRYPSGYTYKPYSRSFVRNLPDGYAQGHPCEDFAETFAVWLDPRSNWRANYHNWPALKKLSLMDSLMKEIKGRRASLICREKYLPLSDKKNTLRTFYKKKRQKEGLEQDSFWDGGLSRIFARRGDERAALFIKKNQKELCKKVSNMTGQPQYRIKDMIEEIAKRSDEMGLQKGIACVDDMSYYLSKKMKPFIKEGRHVISL